MAADVAVVEPAPAGVKSPVEMGMRTGYAAPFGKLGADLGAVTNYFAFQIPFLFDIGLKVTDALFVGGYLGISFGGTEGVMGAACGPGVTCVVIGLRVGFELQYHFMPRAPEDVWIGYGIGVENTGVSASSPSGRLDATFAGVELAHLMAGVDFRVSRALGLGPFAALSIAQYGHETVDLGSLHLDQSIPNKALHEWLMVGGRLVIFP